MKVGLLSDIHGNVTALAAVLDAAKGLAAERLLCAGDLVGYYYEPDRCLELLRAWNVDCVRGNHEDMLLHLGQDPSLAEGIRQRYGSGISVAAEVLTREQLAYLAGLPSRKTIAIQGKTVLLCHGAPWDADQYIYPDSDDRTLRRCTEEACDYVVLGHTHYAFAKRCAATLIVNPGSVGQPRERKPGAAWALLDTETGDITHYSETYDWAKVQAQAMARDPELPYLREVLSRR